MISFSAGDHYYGTIVHYGIFWRLFWTFSHERLYRYSFYYYDSHCTIFASFPPLLRAHLGLCVSEVDLGLLQWRFRMRKKYFLVHLLWKKSVVFGSNSLKVSDFFDKKCIVLFYSNSLKMYSLRWTRKNVHSIVW